VWWHIQTADPGKSQWQQMADAYMKAHPNVKIQISVLENEAFKSKLSTAMQSGNPPDLFQSWGGGVMQEYAKAGLVKDISSALQGDWGSSFSKPVLDQYSLDGKYYGVPWDIGMVGFWYNKALFQKAGINSTPKTWTEFLADVQLLKTAGITPIALGGKDKWPGAFYWEYLATRIGGQAAFNKAYSHAGSFSDPTFVQAGTALQQLVALDPFPKGYLGLAFGDESALMGNGQAAMELMGQWAPGAEKDGSTTKKGLGADLGFFPFPSVEGGAGQLTDVLGGGNGFAVGKNAPAETVDFLRFVTNVDNQKALATTGAALPPVKGAETAITDPLLKQVHDTVGTATYFQMYYDQFLPPAVGGVINDSTQQLFAKSSSPDDTAKNIASAYNDASK
jgi:raffinose/stachyose/melibiose transport system substrate-binding protein